MPHMLLTDTHSCFQGITHLMLVVKALLGLPLLHCHQPPHISTLNLCCAILGITIKKGDVEFLKKRIF